MQDFLLLEENRDIAVSEKKPAVQNGADLKPNNRLITTEKEQNEVTKIDLKYIDDVSDTEIEKLLNEDEKPQEKHKLYKKSDIINIKNCKACWQKDSIMDTLNLDLKLSRGTFTAVVGSVGSGKVSFLLFS